MDEDFFIPLIFFSFMAFMVHKIVSYKRWKVERRLERGGKASKGDEITMSELKTLIEQSVIEATMPLEQRIAGLEKQLRRQPLPSPEEPALEIPEYDAFGNEDVLRPTRRNRE